MKQNALVIEKIINLFIIGTTLLMPIFFLPITTEFYEINKLALLTVSTLVLAVLWGLKLIFSQKVYVIKTPINLAIIIYLAVFILATIFSNNFYLSMFGQYARWFPSLFSFVTVVVFFYIAAINITDEKTINNILFALIAGITINTIVGLLSYFGVYLSGNAYAQTPNFSLVGNPTTAAILAAIAVIIGINKLLNITFMPGRILLVQLVIVNAVLLVLYGIFAAWFVLAIGLISTFVMTRTEKITSNAIFLTVIAGAVAALLLVVSMPRTKELVINDNFAKEIKLDFNSSWIITGATVTNDALLGSGPATFQNNFTLYRPSELNATDFWNIRYDKPYNEIFNIMSSLGIFGAIAAAYLGIKIFQEILATKSNKDDSGLNVMLSASTLAMLSMVAVTYITVLSAFVLFVLLALTTAYNATHTKSKTDRVLLSLASLSTMSLLESLGGNDTNEILQYIVTVPLLIFAGLWGYFLYQTYTPEYYMRKSAIAIQANDGLGVYNNQRRALEINGRRSEYRNAFAQTNLAIANALAQGENVNDETRLNIQNLIAQAIREVKISTEVLNPGSAANWEVRASVYRSLRGVAQNSSQWALQAYDAAIQLDPTNPRLRLEAGAVYYAEQDFLSAANMFRQAANLKPDYANAHFNMAHSLKQMQNYPLAQREFQITQTLVERDSEDYALLQRELEDIAELAASTADNTQENIPTVEELEQQQQLQEQSQPSAQGPLVAPEQVVAPQSQSLDLSPEEAEEIQEQNQNQTEQE